MVRRFAGKVKKFWAGLALLSVEMAIVLALFSGALVAVVFITRRIFIHNKVEFDHRVFDYLQQHVSERNNEIMLFFTFLGKHDFLIPANLVMIAYFLGKRHRWYSIKIPAIAISSLGLMFGLKHFFNRPRPEIPLLEEAKGLSFPSGHALMSVTFYGLLIYIVYKGIENKGWKWTLIALLAILIMMIGFTRVYLRVHYASDVIAGYCIGFLWLVFAVWMLNKMEKYSRRNLDPIVQREALVADAKAAAETTG